ncbi:uncharacterized protein M421DRAFT_389865 [Didymella exigua CBS 183.55]|uniref:Uncharacterized protein n=1 Tax=Didymella exigua CBS 183.55 TaxID=1150837 RepID=A0A6A5R271_9PLEO|nr:uncharacterized protein M421DRAFT_389865 [Didymella exigua CBS 183.55]KAF1922175.1 hypothetical protein M421DRAFT_389865 [Didymella exigua CBS 183.55]
MDTTKHTYTIDKKQKALNAAVDIHKHLNTYCLAVETTEKQEKKIKSSLQETRLTMSLLLDTNRGI